MRDAIRARVVVIRMFGDDSRTARSRPSGGVGSASSHSANRPGRDLTGILGVTHIAGTYHLTDKGFLQQGAEQVLAMGSKVIKLWLFQSRRNCPFHEMRLEANSLADPARAARKPIGDC